MLQISMFPKEIKQKKRNVDSDNRFEYLQKKEYMSIQVRINGWAVNDKKKGNKNKPTCHRGGN